MCGSDKKENVSMKELIEAELAVQGAGFVSFVDVTNLPRVQTRDFPVAILIGISLTKEFVAKVTDTPDYVERLILNKDFSSDEYLRKEQKVDGLADHIASYINRKGYSAISQSEAANEKAGVYNEKNKTSLLPHKTIGTLAGLGWIGKNNLLITEKFGCAFCMCTVLTDAPLEANSKPPQPSHCNQCRICQEICPTNAIKGTIWNTQASRDDLVDVEKCKTCLKCLILCPWTQKYKKGQSSSG
ncbi:MAG: hypothetical protein ACD_28C00260G0003 [uncultured bacterium]|nr:MAG: hypothetical protein ACD_28C00260G0003 [uncultured bacterium]